MTIATWPSDLPQPLVQGYREQRFDARRSRTFDAGPPKFSRRYTAVANEVTLNFRLYAWQKAVFDRFYIETLQEGALPFWMRKLYVDGMSLLDENGVPLLDDEGAPLLWSHLSLCTFSGPPVGEDPRRARQLISFSVVELP